MDSRDIVYSGKYLQMLKAGRWEYVQRTGNVAAVGIIALTPASQIVLVEQYRIPVGANTIELPAGLVGDEDSSEEILSAASRELLEETGFEAGSWQYLFDGPSSAGMTNEQVHLVMADDLRRQHDGGGVAGEAITVHLVPLAHLETFLTEKRSAGIMIDFKVRLAGLYIENRQTHRP